MVNWVCDDSKVVTAVSDSSLCVWDPNTQVNVISHRDSFWMLYVSQLNTNSKNIAHVQIQHSHV